MQQVQEEESEKRSIKLNSKSKKKYIYKKQSEWKVILQVVPELNSLMAMGMNDLLYSGCKSPLLKELPEASGAEGERCCP